MNNSISELVEFYNSGRTSAELSVAVDTRGRANVNLMARSLSKYGQLAPLVRAVSSASDRPYTTPDAWLYRDLFNDIADSPGVWTAGASERVQIRPPTVGNLLCRRPEWGDCAQKSDCTVAISTGTAKNQAPHLAKHRNEDQA